MAGDEHDPDGGGDALRLPGERARDEMAQRLYRQLEEAIARAVSRAWLHGMAMPDVRVLPSGLHGLAGSIMAQASVNVRLFVKCHLTDVAHEQEGYEILGAGPPAFTAHLVPSLVTEHGQVLWLTPHADATPLQALACSQREPSRTYEWLLAVYRDVLAAMECLWLQTRAATVPPDLTRLYVGRITDRRAKIERGLGVRDLDDLTLSVNTGARVTCMTFRDLLGSFERRVRRAGAHVHSSCTAHHDEHGNNIIVDGKAALRDPAAWWIVDYPNARRSSDWVLSIAKMLYGWRCLCVLELAQRDEALAAALGATWRIDEEHRLIVAYDQAALDRAVPPACRACERLVWEFAARMGRAFEEEPTAWRRRLQLAWFSTLFATAGLVFGDAPFMASILIGESVRVLRSPDPLRRLEPAVPAASRV